MGLLQLSPTAIQSHAHVTGVRPQTVKLYVGPRTLIPVGELQWYKLFSRLWVADPGEGVWDLIILQVHAPTMSLWFALYVSGYRISFLVGSSLFH